MADADTFCCEQMRTEATRVCDMHPERAGCPDCIIVKSGAEYGIAVHDGGGSRITIAFCPWCGAKLEDEWFRSDNVTAAEVERRWRQCLDDLVNDAYRLGGLNPQEVVNTASYWVSVMDRIVPPPPRKGASDAEPG